MVAKGRKETEMEKLLGTKLLSNAGDPPQPTSSVLKGTDLVLLYFSASWCPPCKAFTPVLAEFFRACAHEHGFHIVYVSSDKDMKSFNEYYGKMPWAAIPFDSGSATTYGQLKQKLADSLKIRGIPSLIVLDAKTGLYITDGARNEIMNVRGDKVKGMELVEKWKLTEAVPFDQAEFGKGQSSSVIGAIFSFFLRNPLYIFGILYIVKQVLRKLAELGKEEL